MGARLVRALPFGRRNTRQDQGEHSRPAAGIHQVVGGHACSDGYIRRGYSRCSDRLAYRVPEQLSSQLGAHNTPSVLVRQRPTAADRERLVRGGWALAITDTISSMDRRTLADNGQAPATPKIPPEGATARRASRGKHAAATAIEALAAARRRRAVRRGRRPGSRCGARGRRAKRPSVERPDDTLAVAAWARDVVMETERGPASSRPTASSTSSATTSRAGTRPPAGCGSSRSKGRRSDADTVTVTKNEILYSPVRQRRRRRHSARALRPAAVPAGTGLRGGERQLRAQGPAGHRRGPAAGRVAVRDRASPESHDTTSGRR